MTSPGQRSSFVSRTRLGAASPALALLVVLVLGAATQSSQAQTFTVLYSFTGAPDGANPVGNLMQDAEGNLYGTTLLGGNSNSDCFSHHTCGTVFKVDTSGTETVLYSFNGPPDGDYPYAGLVQDAKGNLYGTTVGGGASGTGTVFKLDPGGKETVLLSFGGYRGADGALPYAGLIRDKKGNMYGDTYNGGAHLGGVVFKLDPTGKETVLYRFPGAPNGASPLATLTRDAAGNLYGTTYGGGLDDCHSHSPCGTVFKITKSGKESVLYKFGGHPDGHKPAETTLVRDAAGNLYGTTPTGGGSCGFTTLDCGVVFKVDTTGKETVLYTFCPAVGCADGAEPNFGLVQDAEGNLYGTTALGGSCGSYGYGCGVVFKLDTTGKETVLHAFTGGSDGAGPTGLSQDAAGNLYGTCAGGGAGGYGTVWKLTP